MESFFETEGCRSRKFVLIFVSVKFDQMYVLSADLGMKPFRDTVEGFLRVRLKRQAENHGHAMFLETRIVTSLSDTGQSVWD